MGSFCGATFFLWLLDGFSLFHLLSQGLFSDGFSSFQRHQVAGLVPPSTINRCGPFAVLGSVPEVLQPDPRHLRYLVDHSLVYGLPPVVVSTEP